MSRIGKQPVLIPDKVKVEVKDHTVRVEGPKGKLDFSLPQGISLKTDDATVINAEAGGVNVVAFLDMLAWSEGTSTSPATAEILNRPKASVVVAAFFDFSITRIDSFYNFSSLFVY